MNRICLLAACAALGCSCVLFTPEEPGQPLGPIGEDPFQFQQILDNTGESFSYTGYDDLFVNSRDVYVSQGKSFGKDALIDHLKGVAAEHGDMIVQWSPDTLRALLKTDTADIHPTYRVWLDGNTQAQPSFEAPCTFLLIYRQNRWLIYQWRDGFSGRSIFNPEFN